MNRALEDTLRRWRFRATFTGRRDPCPWFPSIPYDSTIELSMKVSVS